MVKIISHPKKFHFWLKENLYLSALDGVTDPSLFSLGISAISGTSRQSFMLSMGSSIMTSSSEPSSVPVNAFPWFLIIWVRASWVSFLCNQFLTEMLHPLW